MCIKMPDRQFGLSGIFLCRQPAGSAGGFNMLKIKGVKKNDFGLNRKSEKVAKKLLNNYPYNDKIHA